jgi:hypothetical protein
VSLILTSLVLQCLNFCSDHVADLCEEFSQCGDFCEELDANARTSQGPSLYLPWLWRHCHVF